MAITHYLAMTAGEIRAVGALPRHVGWMACHFSSYSTGLTNLPNFLPAGALLILNDRTPIHGHDPQRVCRELSGVLYRFSCSGLLLDFQNPGCAESACLAGYLAGHLDHPMAVTPEYRQENAAVFLPPLPTDTPLQEYLAGWKEQPIWLDTSLSGQTITLTEKGSLFSDGCVSPLPDHCHKEDSLHCHYSIQLEQDAAIFHTWRTKEDLDALLLDAEKCGVATAVGLYQELGCTKSL